VAHAAWEIKRSNRRNVWEFLQIADVPAAAMLPQVLEQHPGGRIRDLRLAQEIEIVGDACADKRKLAYFEIPMVAVDEQRREAGQPALSAKRPRPDFLAAEEMANPGQEPFRTLEAMQLRAPFPEFAPLRSQAFELGGLADFLNGKFRRYASQRCHLIPAYSGSAGGAVRMRTLRHEISAAACDLPLAKNRVMANTGKFGIPQPPSEILLTCD
jgi:hypothetical protein